MKSIAFMNEKGGVGKTTSAASLIVALRNRKFAVTGLDVDPQAGLSELVEGVYSGKARDLGRMLARYSEDDFCVIDTPPNMSKGDIAVAVGLSTGVVIPVVPEMLSLRGLANLLAAQIDRGKIIGLLVVGYRKLTVHHRAIVDKLRELPYPILAVVPHSITVPDSWALAQGPYSYKPAIRMGIPYAYDTLAERVLLWLGKR
jgi:cellulose biosynthesis protein BcsQ